MSSSVASLSIRIEISSFLESGELSHENLVTENNVRKSKLNQSNLPYKLTVIIISGYVKSVQILKEVEQHLNNS